MKGFLFSIEAIIAIIIIIGALVLINTYFLENYGIDIIVTNSQSERINAFYFNEMQVLEDKPNLFCDRIINYNSTGNFSDRNYCEGFQ